MRTAALPTHSAQLEKVSGKTTVRDNYSPSCCHVIFHGVSLLVPFVPPSTARRASNVSRREERRKRWEGWAKCIMIWLEQLELRPNTQRRVIWGRI